MPGSTLSSGAFPCIIRIAMLRLLAVLSLICVFTVGVMCAIASCPEEPIAADHPGQSHECTKYVFRTNFLAKDKTLNFQVSDFSLGIDRVHAYDFNWILSSKTSRFYHHQEIFFRFVLLLRPFSASRARVPSSPVGQLQRHTFGLGFMLSSREEHVHQAIPAREGFEPRSGKSCCA